MAPSFDRQRSPSSDPAQPQSSRGLALARCATLKRIIRLADQNRVEGSRLPVKAGPVPDRLTIWPVDDSRDGLDATFQGASGHERADHHREELSRLDVPHSFRQELNDGWTLRFGPLRAVGIAAALAALVY